LDGSGTAIRATANGKDVGASSITAKELITAKQNQHAIAFNDCGNG
jgi:hypothetical protein